MNPWDAIEKFGIPAVGLVAVFWLVAKIMIPFGMKLIERTGERLDETIRLFDTALARRDDIMTKEFNRLHERLDDEHKENRERFEALFKRPK